MNEENKIKVEKLKDVSGGTEKSLKKNCPACGATGFLLECSKCGYSELRPNPGDFGGNTDPRFPKTDPQQ